MSQSEQNAPARVSVGREESHSVGLALGLAVCAWSVGIATHIYRGAFNPWALLAVTGGLLACVLGIFWPEARASWFQKLLLLFLPVAIFLETGLLLLNETNHGTTIQLAIVVLGLLGLMGALNLSGLRKVIAGIMLAGFLLVLLLGIFRGLSGIDVLMFQARGAEALWHGHNPYSFRYPNVYPPNTPFYGEGVVDASGHWLTYGFPYPPLSLLMSTLGWIVGDVRIAHALAAAATAGLMFAARPGRISALAAALFILTPLSVFVPSQSWTEPLLALNFSLVMFCACRAEKSRLLLPLALGLFLATKQYAVLSLPAVILLVGKGNQRARVGQAHPDCRPGRRRHYAAISALESARVYPLRGAYANDPAISSRRHQLSGLDLPRRWPVSSADLDSICGHAGRDRAGAVALPAHAGRVCRGRHSH